MKNKISTSLIIRGKQMKTNHYFIPIRLAKVKKCGRARLAWNVGKWTLLYYTIGGSINYSTLESNLVDVSKIENMYTLKKFLNIFTRDWLKNGFCGPIYINKLLEITKIWHQVSRGKIHNRNTIYHLNHFLD